ncbi:MAG: hypothetical protein JST00_19245 [Deltaproteobacteria bacterium]|nr:hypothetical protein [Deltaproteobacteria bacterium]
MGHMDWLEAYLEKLDGKEAICPECGAAQIDWRLAGDPSSRFGFAILWCGRCGKGDRLSRLHFPAGVEFVSMFDAEDVAKGVPNIVFVEDDSPAASQSRPNATRRGGRGT